VLVLDRFEAEHDRGSSHGPSRIIRLTYEHADYVRLAREAYAAWEELERDANETLFFRTADVFFGPRERPARGVPEGHGGGGRAPRGARGDGPRAPLPAVPARRARHGVLAADVGPPRLGSLLGGAPPRRRAARVQVRRGEAVARIDRSGDPIRIETQSGSYLARRVIVAAGPWMGKLLPELALPVRVVRQQVLYFLPRRAGRVPDRPLPGLGLRRRRRPGRLFLRAPDLRYVSGPRSARHRRSGPGVDPDVDAGGGDGRGGRRWASVLRRHLPDLADALLVQAHGCAYTVTPDEDFIVDVHPRNRVSLSHLLAAAMVSSFGSVLGRVLVDLALDGRSGSAAFEGARARYSATRPLR